MSICLFAISKTSVMSQKLNKRKNDFLWNEKRVCILAQHACPQDSTSESVPSGGIREINFGYGDFIEWPQHSND